MRNFERVVTTPPKLAFELFGSAMTLADRLEYDLQLELQLCMPDVLEELPEEGELWKKVSMHGHVHANEGCVLITFR